MPSTRPSRRLSSTSYSQSTQNINASYRSLHVLRRRRSLGAMPVLSNSWERLSYANVQAIPCLARLARFTSLTLLPFLSLHFRTLSAALILRVSFGCSRCARTGSTCRKRSHDARSSVVHNGSSKWLVHASVEEPSLSRIVDPSSCPVLHDGDASLVSSGPAVCP